jgi:hypothetical protein
MLRNSRSSKAAFVERANRGPSASLSAARPKENAIVTRYVVAAFLAIGLAGATVAETGKDRKAGEPEPPAPVAKSGKEGKSAKAATPAKDEQPASKKTKQTPFGPVEATSEQPAPAADLASDSFVSAEEKGELVIFRRKTPFGSQVWKKKKSELTADEQALLARGRPEARKPLPAEAEGSAKDTSKPEVPGPQ